MWWLYLLLLNWYRRWFSESKPLAEPKPLATKPVPPYEEKYALAIKGRLTGKPLTEEEQRKYEAIYAATMQQYADQFREDKEQESVRLAQVETSLSNVGARLTELQNMDISTFDRYDRCVHAERLEELNEQVDNLNADLVSIRNKLEVSMDKTQQRIASQKAALTELYMGRYRLNTYATESTPNGNVYMRYNVLDNVFEYYADMTVSTKWLHVVSQRYALLFDARELLPGGDAFVHMHEPPPKSNRVKGADRKDAQICRYRRLGRIADWPIIPPSIKKTGYTLLKSKEIAAPLVVATERQQLSYADWKKTQEKLV